MIAVMLSGVVAYRCAQVGAAPDRLPDHRSHDAYRVPARMWSPRPSLRRWSAVWADAGLIEMWSSSSGGSSAITLRFDLKLSLDVAEQEVQAPSMPPTTCCRRSAGAAVYSKVNPADAPC